METLRDALDRARASGVAIGHFNVSDLVVLKAVFAPARELNVPVIVGASEGERDFVGTRQLAAVVASLRDEFAFPVFLNADHTHSLAKAVEAVKAGYHMVVFDLSSQPLESNIQQTREAVETLKSLNPAVIVEGEIGDIGTGSEIHTQARDSTKGLSTPEDARHFVESTRVDVLAPAVGNTHGMVQEMVSGREHKHLDVQRISRIKQAAGVFLTLHGASGTDDGDLRRAIAAGINVVHVNTELRVAWRQGLEAALAKRPEEVVPYKILPGVVARVASVVRSRLGLFNRK